MAADQASPQVSGLYFCGIKMQLHTIRKTEISLSGDELDTMREILKLAHERLRNAPLIQMSGSPLERQAGLVGPDLFRVKTMLQQMGAHLGAHLPYDSEPDNEPEESSFLITLVKA
ncbi:hypothetical protein [Janthinobacterium sp. B9-8]|uniref:hypothetical protein n=1 Tax=Janthinobacterium sp. B9-8 TaxID=1236179 RepID=UPI00061D210F|nr:hypothetical protein [Janthinobacterium sp. B9-8]AMC34779.1 hypothetical protein VN23_09230 [Janthinobacterium sp. B9-8]